MNSFVLCSAYLLLLRVHLPLLAGLAQALVVYLALAFFVVDAQRLQLEIVELVNDNPSPGDRVGEVVTFGACGSR